MRSDMMQKMDFYKHFWLGRTINALAVATWKILQQASFMKKISFNFYELNENLWSL